jgi:AraC-like DNA-binding protein
MSTRAILPIVDAAAHLGVDVAEALAACGLDARALHDPNAREQRIARETAVDALAELARRAGDRALGLEAARRLQAGDLGIVDLLVGACATLRDAAEMGSRALRLFHDTAELVLLEENKDARYSLVPHTVRVVAPVLAEFAIGAIVQLMRRLSAHDLRLTEVRFSHFTVPHARELEAFFGCPVRFESEYNEIVFPRIYLGLPLPKSDPVLQKALAAAADEMIESLPARASFLDQARMQIAEGLAAGDATLEKIAGALGMQSRTFQRALRRDGATYQELLDDVRRELALQYLGTSDVSLTRVAKSLGFVDASAFARAFRRWTGESPKAYKSSEKMPVAERRKSDAPGAPDAHHEPHEREPEDR